MGPVALSLCVLAPPSHLCTPLPSTGLTPSLRQSPASLVCSELSVDKLSWEHLLPLLSPSHSLPSPAPHPGVQASHRLRAVSASLGLSHRPFPLAGFLCTQLFPRLSLSYPKEICLGVTFSEAPSLTTLKKTPPLLFFVSVPYGRLCYSRHRL